MDTQTLLDSFEEIRINFKDLFSRVSQLEVEPKLLTGSGGGAPVDAEYLVNSANAILTNEIVVTAATGRIIFSDASPQWTTLNVGTQYQFLGVNVAGTLPEWQTFDWDNHIITAGGDGVHTHASNPEGGQLDWDNIWSDAVHDHTNNAEGGTLDHANLTNVTADQHHTAFIGLEDTATTAVSPAADDRIQLNSTSGALSIVSDAGNNKIDFTVNAAGVNHNLLSVTHSDTVVNAVTRGSLVYGNSSPAWDELVLGGISGSVLTRDANDVLWSTGALSFAGAFTLTIPATGTAVLGTGAANRVTYWTGTNTVGSDAGLTVDTANNYFVVANNGGIVNSGGAQILLNSAGAQNQVNIDNQAIIQFDTFTSYRTVTTGTIYRSAPGVSYPFNATSNLIIQSVAGAGLDRDIVFVTGDTPTLTASIQRDGDYEFYISGGGIIHVDGNTDGYVLRGNGTRYIPAQLDYTDLANVSSLAGDGLAWDAVNDEIDLGTPSDVSASSGNTVGAATHSHNVVTTSDGSANHSTILQSNASGQITMDDYYTIDGGTFGISGNELLTVNAVGTFLFSGIAGVRVEDGDWFGNASASARLTFDSSGGTNYAYFSDCNVGVGGVPASLMHVNGIGTSTQGYRLTTTNEQFDTYFTDDAANSNLNMSYTGSGGVDIIVQHDGKILLASTSAAFVGIGDPTPAYPLQVLGTGTQISTSNFYAIANFGDGTEGILLGRDNVANTGVVAPFGNDPLTFWTSDGTWAERVRITPAGLFGISVTPSTRLDIGAGAMEYEEMTAPGAGAANTMRTYAVDDGGGQTALGLVNSSGDTLLLHDGLMETTEEFFDTIIDDSIGSSAFATHREQFGQKAFRLHAGASTVTTTNTLIADDAKDANVALRSDWMVVRTSDNDYNISSANTIPGGSATLYSNGGDVVTLNHNANGSVTVSDVGFAGDSYHIYIDCEWIHA